MRNKLFLKLIGAALAMAVPALSEGMIQWPEATSAPAPFGAMLTLPPAALLLATEPPRPEAAEPTPQPTPASIADAGIADDGLLRVELRSLDAPNRLNLTLSGCYAVEADPGFRFDSGTALALTAAADRVYLAVGGLTIDMGQSLTLTRHQSPEGVESGIRIEESEKRALYCGDLSVTARGDALRCVLKLPVEDYLYGVVAYEMSDSFPLEALKAQAVAARTYAMRRKWQSGKRDYDVVDTTADQVFKGYDPGYANVIRAVDDTRGLVELYEGSFAACYYTASNGGQTALASQVWGGGDDGYLAMTDDPYDLENPRSLQNELTVSPKCEGSGTLKAMLESALGEALAGEGIGAEAWQLDSIASVKPVKPRFEGSRMYDGLQFELRARLLQPAAVPEATQAPEDTAAPAQTPDATAAPEAVTPAPTAAPTEPPMEWVLSDALYPVTLDVYSQIKKGLSLGLNGADYELIDVRTALDDAGNPLSFTLIMRRFGHGVGMSQRGAQWMAGHYGKTWREILQFYYPGLTPARMNWPKAALTRLDDLPGSVGAARPDPSPTPTPKPLPALKEGERYATVTASALNVRERPTTAARVVEQLSRGSRVIVASEPDQDGWVRVYTGEADGFVKAEYLGD